MRRAGGRQAASPRTQPVVQQQAHPVAAVDACAGEHGGEPSRTVLELGVRALLAGEDQRGPFGVRAAAPTDDLGQDQAPRALEASRRRACHAPMLERSRIAVTTSRLTTFSDGVRGKSSKTSTDSGQVYLATPSSSRKVCRSPSVGGDPGPRNDRRARALAQPVVGQRHDRDLVHRAGGA